MSTTTTPVPANPQPMSDSTNTEPTVKPKDPPKTEREKTQNWYRAACAEAIPQNKRDVDSQSLLAKTSAQQGGSRAFKAVMVRADRLWDNNTTLSYAFIDDGVDQVKAQKVRDVIGEWSKYGNIRFDEVSPGESPKIRIRFDTADGSWSYVGKEVEDISKGEATMNLAWVTSSKDLDDQERGVILHEFGHTLGLMHEHQSPLRGNKLRLIDDAVYSFYMETQGWSHADVEAQIIDVYNKQDVSNYSELDTKSIMMYFMPAAMNEEHIRVDPNTELSEIDKAFMRINYPTFEDPELSEKPSPTDKEKKTPRELFVDAVDAVGVDGDDRTKLLELFDDKNWKEIRFEFTTFCNSTRLARKAHDINSGTTQPPTSSDGFEDGCIAESLEDVLGPSASTSGSTASRAVATVYANLWAPGEEITYSWVQGGTDATTYRKQRVRDTFTAYSRICNLTFKEIPYDPLNLTAKIHIFFGKIPIAGVTGWSKIGRDSVGYRQNDDTIKQRGGSLESSMVLSNAVPANEPTDPATKEALKKREERTLFHEIGHALGLKHEHASPNTRTSDKVDTNFSIATLFDENSVMLYADKAMRATTYWESVKAFFNANNTKFNHLPSDLDLAFLGALYPARPGHVDDKFQKDIENLGLKDKFKTLDAQREQAFKYEGHVEFDKEIRKLREMIGEGLDAIKAAKKAAALGPAHAITAPPKKARDATIGSNTTPTTGSFVDELVKTLSSIFQPTTGQIFALQFPGRFIQQDLYAWDTKKAGIYGQFIKPTVVNESEFRLVDQLYNIGKVIGAPSGINLSIVYEQLLNNLVPAIQDSQINMSKQQDEIRKWLLRDVPVSGWVKDLIQAQHQVATSTTGSKSTDSSKAGPAHAINASSAINAQFAVSDKLSEDNKINRMELAEALMQEYLSAKQAWELERDTMIRNEAKEPLDDLTRKLAHITAIREAQLAAKYSDAVVRGYSHTIRQYMGYMDIKTPAEILQDAKDSLRESASSSLDGSMKVYPVQMQPIDWFESLSTSFTMEDLTSDPELIAQQIDNKSKQLDAINTRLATIASGPKVDIQELQKKLDDAQTAYDKAHAELSMTYTSNVLSLAKTCIDANNEFNMTDFKAGAKAARIAEAAFANIETGMKDLCNKQLSVTQTSRAVSQLMAAKSLAEATDTTQEVVQLNVELASLQRDISELTSRLQSLRYKAPAPPPDPAAPAAPTVKPEDMKLADMPDMVADNGTSGGSRWQEIRVSHTVETRYSASSAQSQASTSKTDVSLFFGSYHSEHNESSATSTSAQTSTSNKVDIGFRATMVTVDRGGWFQPQFFKQSGSYHAIDPKLTWSKWPSGVNSIHDFNHENPQNFEAINKFSLPAYPVGFLICKDITIKIAMSATDMKAAGAEMESYAATSAGILCWSTSSSNHSKSSDKSYGFQMVSDGCIIKIPGPQLLGYILQLTDPDQSTPLPEKLPTGFLVSDEDYNAGLANKNTPAHDINSTTTDTTKDKAGDKVEDKPADKSASATTPATK